MNESAMGVWYIAFAVAVFESVVAAVIVFIIKRQFSKHDQRIVARKKEQDALQEKKDAARFEQEKLQLEITMADAKLSYAIVAALKRGSPNGEVEDALKAYSAAHKSYEAFLQMQGIRHIEEKTIES